MAKQKEAIVVSNFHRGIGASSYLGFEQIRNLNITDKPGVCYPHHALAKESSTTVDDLIEGFTITSEGETWGYSKEIDNNVYKRTPAGVWSKFAPGGSNHTDVGIGAIQFWKGYVAVIQIGGSIDWYDITDDSCDTSWGADISDAPGTDMCALHSAYDDFLYIAGGQVIDRIEEGASGFDPAGGDPANFIITKALLTLPEGYSIIKMVELGDRICIATKKTGYDHEGQIFVWDPTTSNWERILTLKDESIMNLIVVDNMIYIQGGRKGRWYISNGVSIQKIAQIPHTLADLASKNLENVFAKNSICYLNGLIYFGVGIHSNNAPLAICGVWSLNPQTYALNFEYTISAGEYGQTSSKGVYIGALSPAIATSGYTTNLNVSWFDDNGSAYGVDDIGSDRYTSEKAFSISQFYRIATNLNKRTINQIEVQLSKPMASGDSVKIYYREAQNASWTNIVNDVAESSTVASNTAFMSYAADGAIQSKRIDRAIDVENIQFKITLDDEAELLEAILL